MPRGWHSRSMRSRASSLRIASLFLLGSCLITANGDFGEAVMYEAADLSEAHTPEQKEEVQSMESLLHWAIQNSDHEELAQRAEETRTDVTLDDLKLQLEARKARVQELRQYMDSQVTETQLIKDAVAVLDRDNATTLEQLWALKDLQVLVEPIDNANDLKVLGGIEPVVHLLVSGGSQSDPSAWSEQERMAAGSSTVRSAAAHVLGTAASNNVKFQGHLMEQHPGVYASLVELALSDHEEEALKGMYAMAAMVRNLQNMHVAFFDAGGYLALEWIMSGGESVGPRVKRKALALYVDLLELSPVSSRKAVQHAGLLSAALKLLNKGDLDMTEKALSAIKALISGPFGMQVLPSMKEEGTGTKLEALHSQLLADRSSSIEAGEDEVDDYADYILKLCLEIQQALQLAEMADATGSDSRGVQGGRSETAGDTGEAAGLDKEGNVGDELPLQLGHAEL